MGDSEEHLPPQRRGAQEAARTLEYARPEGASAAETGTHCIVLGAISLAAALMSGASLMLLMAGLKLAALEAAFFICLAIGLLLGGVAVFGRGRRWVVWAALIANLAVLATLLALIAAE